MTTTKNIKEAALILRQAKYTVVFTGAGISVESGLPTFRGEGGIWKEVDPNYFNIDFFHKKPRLTWEIIKKVFYDPLTSVKPNIAHHILSVMGQHGIIQTIITQNIDHLHQEAGCQKVIELHGTYRRLVCTKCSMEYDYSFADLNYLPPTCFVCRGVLKPDFVFFNEELSPVVKRKAFEEVQKADVFLVIGTRAEVYPANTMPRLAKERGAAIIEINLNESPFTEHYTDIFIKMGAGDAMKQLCQLLACRQEGGNSSRQILKNK